MTGIIAHLLTQPVTITARNSATDVYGNTVPVDGTAAATVGYLEQTASTEVLTDRETVVSDWVAYLPAETTIGELDKVTFAGQAFEVVGLPARLWNPRTSVYDHLEVHLREVS